MSENSYKVFTEKSINKFVDNIRKDIDNKSLEFDIDNDNLRVGLKKSSDSNFVYTDSLRGLPGTSITDIHTDPQTGEVIVTLSDSPSIVESVVADYYKTSIVNINETEVDITLTPNKFYSCGTISKLMVTLEAIVEPSITNEYMIEFETGDVPPTVVFESSINWVTTPDWKPNMRYQVSILNNIGIIVGVPVSTV